MRPLHGHPVRSLEWSAVKPIYDPALTYEQNYAEGPFGAFADPQVTVTHEGAPLQRFFGLPVWQTFGIPAGPLLNERFTTAAFRAGFDICVYKTVRSSAYPCNPFPNILSVKVDGALTPDKLSSPLLADAHYDQPLSISNSFGVPSQDPDIWQPDMAEAVRRAGDGQVLVGSFQGTRRESTTVGDSYIQDHVRCARMVVETGAPVLELNLSCPNEGTAQLLCFDTPRVRNIVAAVKEAVGNIPLVLKLAYFSDQQALENLISQTSESADGYAAINTIPARLVDAQGNQALPGEGRAVSGVCGAAVTWAGLDMTARLAHIRDELERDFTIVGVGGVDSPQKYHAFRDAGADAVMSATGAMWNPLLAQEIAGIA